MDKVKVILAKFWVAILCGVIALAAIIASFVPLESYHQALFKKLETSAANFGKADGLLHKSRNKPLLPGQITPDPLTVFPSKSIIATGKALRDQLNVESEKSVKTVVEINRHQPLLPILPNPNGVDGINYRTAYVRRLIGQNGGKDTLFTDQLKAGTPPTAEEIKAESDRIYKAEYENQLVPDPNNPGKSMNEDSVKAQFKQRDDALPALMRQTVANTNKIYAGKDAIPIDLIVSAIGALPPDPRKIWWSQMQLWLIEDVSTAIAEANKDATNVLSAPVKRLLKIEVPGVDEGMLFTNAKTGVAAPPMVADASVPALTADANTPVHSNKLISPTGRVSNLMYDVIQFRLEMVVAAKDIPWIIHCICRGRLMSVINVESIVSEDTTAADAAGFSFGPDQVVRISLRCETLFMREWTLPLMPESVKKSLVSGIVPANGQ